MSAEKEQGLLHSELITESNEGLEITASNSQNEELDGSDKNPKPHFEQQALVAISDLKSCLDRLNQSFQNRLSYDKAKEEAFDRLYSEMEEVKSNSAFDHVRPLYIDLILLFDRIENALRENADLPSINIELLRTLSDEVLEILYRREVEVLNNTGPAFNPAYQKAIGTEPTTIEAENNQVVRVIRRGFRARDYIVRAEEVIVKKYKSSGSSWSA